MTNGGTEENKEKPQVRIAGLLVWTTDLQNKECYPLACNIQCEKMLNWWILNGVALFSVMSFILHSLSHSQSKNTHTEVKQCCWYSTHQTDSQIHWLVLGLFRNCCVRYTMSNARTMNWKGCARLQLWLILTYYYIIYVEVLRKWMPNHSDQSPVWNMNHVPPGYISVLILAL